MTSRSASAAVGSVPPARHFTYINKFDLLFADNAKTTTLPTQHAPDIYFLSNEVCPYYRHTVNIKQTLYITPARKVANISISCYQEGFWVFALVSYIAHVVP